MKTFQYYSRILTYNLFNLNRSAKEGKIDISVTSNHSISVSSISQETIGLYTDDEIKELQSSNEKAKYLDLNHLKNLTFDEIRSLIIKNFKEAILNTYKVAIQIKNNSIAFNDFDMENFIESISKILGNGIVKNEYWFRIHDSDKFPYTKSHLLKNEFVKFCQDLKNKIEHRPKKSKKLKKWAKNTAAWIEYRINLIDHFTTDNCAKLAAIVSAFICMIADTALPVFTNRNDYFFFAPKKPRALDSEDKDNQLEYFQWKKQYIKKF